MSLFSALPTNDVPLVLLLSLVTLAECIGTEKNLTLKYTQTVTPDTGVDTVTGKCNHRKVELWHLRYTGAMGTSGHRAVPVCLCPGSLTDHTRPALEGDRH